MKKILITGANSYIGASFEKYIKENFAKDYLVDTVDMIDGAWVDKDFSPYDAVFHVAGVVHKKESKSTAHLYYEINRDLTYAVAVKAKDEGVKQFVFLSSMSVYGKDAGVITKTTAPNPKTHYGKSKLQAEEKIRELNSESFAVCVLRPPMVYGEGCKGNYQKIAKIVEKFGFFPKVKNKRSLIYIDNLSSFVKTAIDKNLSGIYFPQNKDYVCTADLAAEIARAKNRKIRFSRLLGLAVIISRPFFPQLKKAFGNLIYKDTEDFCFEYCRGVKSEGNTQ